MEVFKTYVFFSDHDQGLPYEIETVEQGGQWWLVGSWRRDTATGERIPKRIVLLSALPHQEVEGQSFRFVLNQPIPKAVLDGEARTGYVAATYRARVGSPAPKPDRLH